MPKFRVYGTYVMTYEIDIDEEVEADSAEDAIGVIQELQTPEKHNYRECHWASCGPAVVNQSLRTLC